MGNLKSKQSIHGLLLIDKSKGISSNQAITLVKRMLNPKKIGHTGTLDPLATGLLPICLGDATNFRVFYWMKIKPMRQIFNWVQLVQLVMLREKLKKLIHIRFHLLEK